ncbi:MAG: DNA (cytosine-5-)-methyltransferase, partial [Ruminococcus sp.]|nr:DNA (cytosine-5-)-methyltransferase [Ruminococcus sp.]
MDFCSGIGGGRLGLAQNGLKCIAYSEISEKANRLYKIFYGNNEKNYGDLTKITPESLPDFDMLICGFPCQTFSIVGKRAGFADMRGQII